MIRNKFLGLDKGFWWKQKSGGLNYSPEVMIYLNQFTDLPTKSIMDQVALFIDTLVTQGIYTKIDEMWLYAMNSAPNALCGVKGVKSGVYLNPPTFEAYRGFTGSITDASGIGINNQWIPSVDGVNYQLNSASVGVYLRDNGSAVYNNDEIGTQSHPTSQKIQVMVGSNSVLNMRVALNSPLSGTTALGSNVTGLSGAVRNNNTTLRAFKSGLFLDIASITDGISTIPLYTCGRNSTGTITSCSNRQIAFAFVGGYLTDTEITQLRTALEDYLDYVGAGVI